MRTETSELRVPMYPKNSDVLSHNNKNVRIIAYVYKYNYYTL